VLLLAGVAMGQSTISFTLELNGDNHVADWENPTQIINTAFTPGSAAPGQQFTNGTPGAGETLLTGGILTWDVVAQVAGIHSGDAADTQGIANMVFTLVLKDSTGAVVATTAWQSTMNDGDSAGKRRSDSGTSDPAEKAAWCLGWDVDLNYDGTLDGLAPPVQTGRLFDPVTAGGPYMDRVQFPSVVGFGGGHFSGGEGNYVPKGAASPPAVGKITPGELLGMGIGYSQIVAQPGAGSNGFGIGLALGSVQPLWLGGPPFGGFVGVGAEPAAEGQINLSALDTGTYTLELTAPLEAQNIIKGTYDPYDETLSQNITGGFAARADAVADNNGATDGDKITFNWRKGAVVAPPVNVQEWQSRRAHTGLGDLPIVLSSISGQATVEPRLGSTPGIRKLWIRCDKGLVDGENVFLNKPIGIAANPVEATPMAVVVTGGVVQQFIRSSGGAVANDVLEVNVAPCTDKTCYTFSVTGGPSGATLVVVSGTADANTCNVAALIGDASSSATTNPKTTNNTDMTGIRNRINVVPDSTTAKYDINVSGVINNTDLTPIRSRINNSVTCNAP
jgi:hypothetical protein